MSINEVCTNSKKVKSFVVMALAIIVCMMAGTVSQAPENVITQALWIIGFGGMFAIGGQSLVDSIEKFAIGKSSVSVTNTNKTEITKEEK